MSHQKPYLRLVKTDPKPEGARADQRPKLIWTILAVLAIDFLIVIAICWLLVQLQVGGIDGSLNLGTQSGVKSRFK